MSRMEADQLRWDHEGSVLVRVTGVALVFCVTQTTSQPEVEPWR